MGFVSRVRAQQVLLGEAKFIGYPGKWRVFSDAGFIPSMKERTCLQK